MQVNIPIQPQPGPPYAVIPLPPNDYDPNYIMVLVQVLTFMMQQAQSRGTITGAALSLYTSRAPYNATKEADFLFNTQDNNDTNTWMVIDLPEAPDGLGPDQIWVDRATGTLRITPGNPSE